MKAVTGVGVEVDVGFGVDVTVGNAVLVDVGMLDAVGVRVAGVGVGVNVGGIRGSNLSTRI